MIYLVKNDFSVIKTGESYIGILNVQLLPDLLHFDFGIS